MTKVHDGKIMDLRGLCCPLPLLKVKQAMSTMQPGQVVEVLCTDPGSVRDFVSYARFSGHTLLSREVKQEAALEDPDVPAGESLLHGKDVFVYKLKHK